MDAAFAIPSQTQSPVVGGLPKAQDMTRHLNRMTRHREPSALKELYKYMTVPGMVSEWECVDPLVTHSDLLIAHY